MVHVAVKHFKIYRYNFIKFQGQIVSNQWMCVVFVHVLLVNVHQLHVACITMKINYIASLRGGQDKVLLFEIWEGDP